MDKRQDTFASRLDLAMKKANLNQVELSDLTESYPKKISQSLINKYLKGKAIARQDNTYILAKILNVDEGWLHGYNVPMERMPDHLRTTNNIITYTAIDNSMSPLLDVGDIAYVEKKNTFKSNETILFILDGIEYIRKIIIEEDYYEFRAMNPETKLIIIPKEKFKEKSFKVIGKVIKAENKSAFK